MMGMKKKRAEIQSDNVSVARLRNEAQYEIR